VSHQYVDVRVVRKKVRVRVHQTVADELHVHLPLEHVSNVVDSAENRLLYGEDGRACLIAKVHFRRRGVGELRDIVQIFLFKWVLR
jgi:hypothetical protein